MGTTLHAFVECWYEGLQGLPSQWDEIAEISFQKDYPLMRLLHEELKDNGWPADSSVIARGAREECGIDQGLRHCSLTELEYLVVMYDMMEDRDDGTRELPSPQLRGTVALMKAVEQDDGPKTRILFWEV